MANNFSLDGSLTTSSSSSSSTLFIPTINVLQERSLDKRLTLNVDFQNNELYILQELTRSAAILNYIHTNGRQTGGGGGSDDDRSKVNNVFERFLNIDDPMSLFIDNFEQFFAMYIHSKYGRNNFKIFMKECEKSNVAYPINVFEDGMCIFMQYNKCELRTYIYNIITMFYYYTGQSFYDMICPTSNRIPRPGDIDEYNDDAAAAGTGGSNNKSSVIINNKTAMKRKSRADKLCALNRHNYNINRPFIQPNGVNGAGGGRRADTFITNAHFEKCILTSNFPNERQYDEVIIGKVRKPVVVVDPNISCRNQTVLPNVACDRNGMSKDSKIYTLSEHLQRSCNFERNTMPDDDRWQSTSSTPCKQRTYVQTNFAKIWSCDNRRHIVSLNIVYSVLNVCIQKITFSLLEAKNRQNNDATTYDPSTCTKIFSCIQNPNDIDVRETLTTTTTQRGSTNSAATAKQFIKPKKTTIEVSFNRELPKRSSGSGSIVDNLQFSI